MRGMVFLSQPSPDLQAEVPRVAGSVSTSKANRDPEQATRDTAASAAHAPDTDRPPLKTADFAANCGA